MKSLALAITIVVLLGSVHAGEPKAGPEPVDLVGRVSEYWFSRNWESYYWREDFSFLLTEDGTGKVWRIISREPTPAYTYRMGTTFTGLKVDWKAGPKVKVIGVRGVDRIPVKFYDFKLNEPNLATALLVFVETEPKTWSEFYVNNWFHRWSDRADKLVHSLYADKPAPYQIFGFARSQSAPFTRESQAIIDRNKANPSLMFQGRVKTAKGNAFGYEIELIDLIGRDVLTGGATLLYGDAKTIPLLDGRKPKE